jgi:hypothetical protein
VRGQYSDSAEATATDTDSGATIASEVIVVCVSVRIINER